MRVDFYLLTVQDHLERWLLACRLIEKAYLLNHQIFIYCSNQNDAEKLDELLWTFKDNSFLPHNIFGEGPEPPPPIQIGYQREPRGFNDILINLALEVPAFYQRFRRILEIVDNNETVKETSRLHYKHYQKAQCSLHIHKL